MLAYLYHLEKERSGEESVRISAPIWPAAVLADLHAVLLVGDAAAERHRHHSLRRHLCEEIRQQKHLRQLKNHRVVPVSAACLSRGNILLRSFRLIPFLLYWWFIYYLRFSKRFIWHRYKFYAFLMINSLLYFIGIDLILFLMEYYHAGIWVHFFLISCSLQEWRSFWMTCQCTTWSS